jgi:hypothetical protein
MAVSRKQVDQIFEKKAKLNVIAYRYTQKKVASNSISDVGFEKDFAFFVSFLRLPKDKMACIFNFF